MNSVTELMLPIEGENLKCRLWIDVTDIIESSLEGRGIDKRKQFCFQMVFIELSHIDTLRAMNVLKDKLAPLQFVNAFEVTDANGVGYVHYFNWP